MVIHVDDFPGVGWNSYQLFFQSKFGLAFELRWSSHRKSRHKSTQKTLEVKHNQRLASFPENPAFFWSWLDEIEKYFLKASPAELLAQKKT